jgi:hypothetical protein
LDTAKNSKKTEKKERQQKKEARTRIYFNSVSIALPVDIVFTQNSTVEVIVGKK